MSRINTLINSVSTKEKFFVIECKYGSKLNAQGNQNIEWETKFQLKSAHLEHDTTHQKKINDTIEGKLTTLAEIKLICEYFEIPDLRKLRIKRVIGETEVHLYKIKSYAEDLSLKRSKHHSEIYIQEINNKGEVIAHLGD